MIVGGVILDRREGWLLADFLEFQNGGGTPPSEIRLAVAGAIAAQSRMPIFAGFGEDAGPTELFFERIGIAQHLAIGRTKLDKITVSLESQFRQHEQILPEL